MKYFIVFASLFTIASCQPDKKASVGGKGGAATINIYPQHHTIAKNIINGKVYIRYGLLNAPANGQYDDSAACTNHDSLLSCSFTGLNNGDYYFLATGYDTSINQAVKGGSPYTITQQAVQSFNLPVSEQ